MQLLLTSRAKNMQSKALRSDFLLLLAAFIWGTTFVAQRSAMDYVGPMTYIGLRFALGGLTLLPVIFQSFLRGRHTELSSSRRFLALGGGLAGLALFAASSLQQAGLIYTTAGKAGFITSLYVVIVPLMGLFLGHRCQTSVWAGAALAVAGLYLLSIKGAFNIGRGDLLVLASAFFWAIHVLLIGYLAMRENPVHIACVQFFACSVLGLLSAGFFEDVTIQAICSAAIPILYGGVLSAGVAFTLQVICQRTCPPAHAAIIMSMENVFAVLAGWVILNERLSLRGFAGCGLMLTGLLVVQLPPVLSARQNRKTE